MNGKGYGLITSITLATVIILALTDLIRDYVTFIQYVGVVIVLTGTLPLVGSFIAKGGMMKFTPVIVILIGLSLIYVGWVMNFIGV